MFAAIRTMIVTFCASITSLFRAVDNGSRSLEALSEYGLESSEMVRDRARVERADELANLAKQLKSAK